MSRTKKGSKPVGYDFWSRRSPAGNSGKIAKNITKREERARENRMLVRIKKDTEDFDLRFAGE